ncbi:uncharacterized [Tachysurus ichikawai]
MCEREAMWNSLPYGAEKRTCEGYDRVRTRCKAESSASAFIKLICHTVRVALKKLTRKSFRLKTVSKVSNRSRPRFNDNRNLMSIGNFPPRTKISNEYRSHCAGENQQTFAKTEHVDSRKE